MKRIPDAYLLLSFRGLCPRTLGFFVLGQRQDEKEEQATWYRHNVASCPWAPAALGLGPQTRHIRFGAARAPKNGRPRAKLALSGVEGMPVPRSPYEGRVGGDVIRTGPEESGDVYEQAVVKTLAGFFRGNSTHLFGVTRLGRQESTYEPAPVTITKEPSGVCPYLEL
jgi:hypothetical protein